MGLFNIKNTIPVKFFTMAAAIIITFCVAIIWLYNMHSSKLVEDRHQMVKNQVETAWGILDTDSPRQLHPTYGAANPVLGGVSMILIQGDGAGGAKTLRLSYKS